MMFASKTFQRNIFELTYFQPIVLLSSIFSIELYMSNIAGFF